MTCHILLGKGAYRRPSSHLGLGIPSRNIALGEEMVLVVSLLEDSKQLTSLR